PATGMSGIEKDRLILLEQRSEATGIELMRDRGYHQHDEIGAADRLREVRRHQVDRHEAVVDAGDPDAALPAQRLQPLGVAGMQAHRQAAQAEIGRRRAAAMPRSQNGDMSDHRTLPNCDHSCTAGADCQSRLGKAGYSRRDANTSVFSNADTVPRMSLS